MAAMWWVMAPTWWSWCRTLIGRGAHARSIEESCDSTVTVTVRFRCSAGRRQRPRASLHARPLLGDCRQGVCLLGAGDPGACRGWGGDLMAERVIDWDRGV
jgi:hypothetical protein